LRGLTLELLDQRLPLRGLAGAKGEVGLQLSRLGILGPRLAHDSSLAIGFRVAPLPGQQADQPAARYLIGRVDLQMSPVEVHRLPGMAEPLLDPALEAEHSRPPRIELDGLRQRATRGGDPAELCPGRGE